MFEEMPHFDDEESREAAEEYVERLADELENMTDLPSPDLPLPSEPYIVSPPDLPSPSEN
jgi:hypothetical protein